MRISIPGLGVQYVDEAPPAGEAPVQPAEAPFLSVDDAIRQAQARELVSSAPASVVEASPPVVETVPLSEPTPANE